MDSSYGPLYSSMSAPSEYIHCWEDSNVHLPASNNAQLISNGYEFTELPWYPQCDFTHVGLTSAGPTPSVCFSTEADVAAEQVDPLSIIAQEHQEVTPDFLFLHQPSPQPFHAPPCPHFCRSPPPHTVQGASPLPSISFSPPTRMSSPSLSDEEARRILDTWIMNSDWLRQDKMEPLVGSPGVPTCALRLASNGQSIYCCFLIAEKARRGKISGWKSATDPTSTPDRHQRAIGKERAKRGHCPFKCPRDHDPDCDFKGCSKENLSDHRARRNNPIKCSQCPKSIATKNMQRHLQAVHQQ